MDQPKQASDAAVMWVMKPSTLCRIFGYGLILAYGIAAFIYLQVVYGITGQISKYLCLLSVAFEENRLKIVKHGCMTAALLVMLCMRYIWEERAFLVWGSSSVIFCACLVNSPNDEEARKYCDTFLVAQAFIFNEFASKYVMRHYGKVPTIMWSACFYAMWVVYCMELM